jgi:CRP-like cAMP-binding protein
MREMMTAIFWGSSSPGEVAVVKDNGNGEPKQLAIVGPGASLGEMSLINGKPRFATCVAKEPTDIAVLTRDTIYDILVLHPSLGNKVLADSSADHVATTCAKQAAGSCLS